MKKVLLIDDKEHILETLSCLLELEGYDVISASDGKTGIIKAFEHKPDVIISDYSMTDKDGLWVLEQIRSNPQACTTPFIVLTCNDSHKKFRECMNKGADDMLGKFSTKDEIINAIEAQLKKVERRHKYGVKSLA